jgi:CheY-like chemotaxis protein
MTTTVLVADDDPDLRETVGDILEAEGYGVLNAHNGLEALDLLHATSPPLVVLLDLQMPQLDGAGVLRVVAANKKLATRNHYILMTAHRRSLPLTFAHLLFRLHILLLPKPFDVEQVVTMVADAAHTLPAQ